MEKAALLECRVWLSSTYEEMTQHFPCSHAVVGWPN